MWGSVLLMFTRARTYFLSRNLRIVAFRTHSPANIPALRTKFLTFRYARLGTYHRANCLRTDLLRDNGPALAGVGDSSSIQRCPSKGFQTADLFNALVVFSCTFDSSFEMLPPSIVMLERSFLRRLWPAKLYYPALSKHPYWWQRKTKT
jgi:hypothetical protein